MTGGFLLDRIADATRRRVASARSVVPWSKMLDRLPSAPETRPFANNLGGNGLSVIAEVKRASPSNRLLAPGLDPVATAVEYAKHGAAAISVLTEPDFFDGDVSHLRGIRKAVDKPLLMKDFILDEYQVLQARVNGADCILLIVALLGRGELQHLRGTAEDLHLETLVEVHDEDEMRIAIDAGARLIGVNNRNLRTLEVDLDVSRRLARLAPDEGLTLVCESGLSRPEQLREMEGLGFKAFLIGTRLVSSGRPGDALRELLDGRD